MSERFDRATWFAIQERLSAVEAYIPEAPPWRPETAAADARGRVRLGSAFVGGGQVVGGRIRIVLALGLLGLLLALAFAALVGAPRQTDLSVGPHGPFGNLRASDGNTQAALLPDGRVLIVSGEWQGPAGTALGRADLRSDGGLASVAPPLVARVSPTVTLLLDGRVLVVGGLGWPYAYGAATLASAEIWDPSTSAFEMTGAMSTGRVDHTATLLSDGRVLIVGGWGPSGAVSAVEIWDPASGGFETVGTLGSARAGHAATLLLDGQVLVVGGRDDAGAGVGTVELWSPATGAFAESTHYLDEPPDVSATRLRDGRVLIAGSFLAPGGFVGASIWPAGQADSVTLSAARPGHAATRLLDGDVLVSGGRDDAGEALRSVERFDAATGTFLEAPALPVAAFGHTVVLLPDGRVLLVLDAGGPDGFIEPIAYDPGGEP